MLCSLAHLTVEDVNQRKAARDRSGIRSPLFQNKLNRGVDKLLVSTQNVQ